MSKKKNNNDNQKVLFQNLGNVWYCFTEVNGKVIYTPVPKNINPNSQAFEFYEVVKNNISKTPHKKEYKKAA